MKLEVFVVMEENEYPDGYGYSNRRSRPCLVYPSKDAAEKVAELLTMLGRDGKVPKFVRAWVEQSTFDTGDRFDPEGPAKDWIAHWWDERGNAAPRGGEE